MPQNITDVSTFTDPVTSVLDGEAVSAANRTASIQALSNRTRFLFNNTVGSGGNYTLWIPAGAMEIVNGAASNFAFQHYPAATNAFGLVDTTVPGSVLWTHIQMPPIGKLIAARAIVDGGNVTDNHGVLPGLPGFDIFTTAMATGVGDLPAPVSLFNVADPSGNLAAYELVHDIPSGVLSHTILSTNTYLARFVGETGGSAINNAFCIFGIELTIEPV